MPTLVSVKCSCCKTPFNTTLRRFNEANKHKWNFFCSEKCQSDFKRKRINLKCTGCEKDITIRIGEYNRSRSKRFFCNKSCAARANNTLRGERTDIVRKHIRNGIEKHFEKLGKPICPRRKCPICETEFKPRRYKDHGNKEQICCSAECSYIYKFGIQPYTKDDVINMIIENSKKHNRTPQKRDCDYKLYHASVKFFGTWNKAVKEAGLKPNHSKYQKIRLKCQDGHMADSISEKTIDDWLYNNHINHVRSKRYPESNFDCDFYLTDFNTWVEYFGLHGGQIPEYEEGITTKRNIAAKHNLKLIGLLPNDLYPDNKLDAIFNDVLIGRNRLKPKPSVV